MFTRREALYGLGTSLGSVAFSALLAAEDKRAQGPLAPRKPHVPAKAKACIFLMMEGGPSHIDTFDPKPKLTELHLKEFQRNDKMQSAMSGGKRYFVASPFKFAKVFTRHVGHGALQTNSGDRHAVAQSSACVLLFCSQPMTAENSSDSRRDWRRANVKRS